MPGPPPTPTDILKLHGSDLPDRKGKRGRRGEPKPEKKAPACPRRLSKEERAVWKETVPLLQSESYNVLTVVDGALLEMYCRLVVEERELSVFLNDNDLTVEIETKGGGTYQQLRPEATERKERRATIRQIQMQFGMSPASRTRIQVEPDEKPAGVKTRARRQA